MKIVAIVGSYHKGGIIDSAVDELLTAAARDGAEVHKIHLLDYQIRFCTNCQSCTQEPGTPRGRCPVQDDVPRILEMIESSNAIVLASPMNFWTVTALMKCFIERLICYAYWPWGQLGPKARIEHKNKRAVIIASCAAPALLGQYLTSLGTLLRRTARLLGAGKIDTFFIGLARHTPTSTLSRKARAKAARLGRQLAR